MPGVEMWNQRYASETFAYGTEPNKFLVQSLPYLPPGNILSLGEGEGRNAVYLAGQGYNVCAVDFSAQGLKKARRLAADRSVSIDTKVSDLATFEIEENYWDGIINIFCHLPSKIRQILHHGVTAGLKPGGVYLMETFSGDQVNYQTGGPRQADLLMDLTTVKKELDGLSVIHAAELEREVIEGQYHTGLSAVIQIIARKSV